ncbi:MAG TPA: sterol desaturase family protein [Oligoflexus sp.]|uniref:sterol desaturase family protein n=1 Tax=Oligoflexus sp. TaxID=1971216 RepID=UPI002D4A5EEC|nr:sterol desaturase family protein [Oligoflexus sp.]HYX35190.1 sterol desaturase family protein [Oligoflexus sp.]
MVSTNELLIALVLIECIFFFILTGSLWKNRGMRDFKKIVISNTIVIGTVFFIESSFALFGGNSNQSHSLLSLCLAVLLYEFIFYWFHRISHRNLYVWYASHFAHHKPKEFGFFMASIVAYGYLIGFNIFACLCLMLLDVHQELAFVVVYGSSALAFIQHYGDYKKVNLGWLEYLINTPANHAVHHASNPELIDKNFGNVFLFFDHLFGTFLYGHRAIEKTALRFGTIVEVSYENWLLEYTFAGERHLWRRIRDWMRKRS